MPQNQEELDQNKINILLDEYSTFYVGVIRTEGLLKALKQLPDDMILERDKIVSLGPGMPPAMTNKTVKDRLEEVERDNKILSARLGVTKEMLKSTPGGKEALENWKWKTSQKDE